MMPPCQNCPDRHLACHDTCERYQAFKAERQEINKQRVLAAQARTFQIERTIQAREERRRHKPK